ncbi:RDD family protein [Sporotomaculum syntrophicum]|uniref:RDD family protein n=1 Tax=Sporotomaculum syntrophicum TaxID=182264 RepID=A0A9D3AXH3_9FIRM|nr:Ig-like domain-containing protein [Sporotomaculum syntrophicum]KAF1084446.1 RDD family protein [Sporotomaculum syntrophicum]
MTKKIACWLLLPLYFLFMLFTPNYVSADEPGARLAVSLKFLEPTGTTSAVEFTVNNGKSVTVGDKVPIAVASAPEAGISKIVYYVDGVVKHSSTAQSYIWDTSGTAPGSHYIKVKVIDNNGLAKLTTKTVIINRQFTVNNGKTITVGDKVLIAVASAPEAGISKIVYYVDGVVKHSSTARSYTWDTGGTAPGSHALKVKVVDKNGQEKASTQTITVYGPSKITVDFTVNNGKPIKVGDKVPITAAIISNAGISNIEYYVDSTIKKATTDKSYIWDTSGTSLGNHALKVKVTDYNGQVKASVHLVSVKPR